MTSSWIAWRRPLAWCVAGMVIVLAWWYLHQRDACLRAVAPPDQDTYYVAPQGTGTACTLACPCAFRTATCRLRHDGETIRFRAGVYDDITSGITVREVLP